MRPWSVLMSLLCGAVLVLSGCAGDDEEPTPTGMSIEKIGGFTHTGGLGAAEIVAFDPLSKRLFVVNGAQATLDVLDLTRPENPTLITTLASSSFGSGLGGINSVAVHSGVVALAIEAARITDPGTVVLLRASDLRQLGSARVGALPDMLTFTPDGRHLLVANEGEPNSYGQPDSVDPEGSVSIIELGALGPNVNAVAMTVHTADFRAFNNQAEALRAAGVRIYGPGATVAQDLEPEYIAVSDDSTTAWVTLQENNAIAIVDIPTRRVTAIRPLGLKDHNLAGMGLDASDEDGGTNTNSGTPSIAIKNYPVKGMYMPDAVAAYTVGGVTYLVTANEGDAREYTGIAGGREDPRVRDYCNQGLDPTVFGANAANLLFDSNLGRLRITHTPNGGRNGKNAQGQCNELLAFGTRSFSIWRADTLARVYDSGEELERRTAALHPRITFNASNDNDTFDNRSPAKGPEPEGVVIAYFGRKAYAFVALERVGGVMVFDVTNPAAAQYVTYVNSRTGATGDRGPEGLIVVRASESPNGKPLLIVGHETSGTTAIYEIRLTY
ncbi:MAG: choice-of-anchor I family protein [Casimicrobiaceae bacterium]|nr:choice-of-anchor I family protein [Casimicrobiaceae bacterium]